jgi:lipopolysaccharide export system permease protein
LGTLTRYLNRMLLLRFTVIFVAVSGFAIVLDLLDVGTRILRRTEGGALTLVWYAAMRLPSLVTDLLPLLVLLAALVTMFDLIRHRELVIVWGAGVSRGRLMLRLLPAALLLCGLKLAIDDVLIPRTMPSLRELGVAELGRVVGATEQYLWLRSGQDVIRLPTEAETSATFTDVLIFHRDPSGKLVEQIRAARARVEPDGWHLEEVLRQPAAAQPARREASLVWPVAVDASKLELMSKLPRELELWGLIDVLWHDGYGISSIEGHRTWFHARLAGGVTVVLMAFLGVALARRFSRRGIAFQLFAQGLSLGFCTMIIQGMMLAFGEVGLLVPELAAWTVPLAVALFVLLSAQPSWLPPQRRALPPRAALRP